jgi:ATP-dependent DNA helicase 2 subunit 2
MADKEATVYIIDVGKLSGDMRHGRGESDLEYAMKYVWERITNTVRCSNRAGYPLTFAGPHCA